MNGTKYLKHDLDAILISLLHSPESKTPIMHLPPGQSFTPLATIRVQETRILHPNACNPAMDLVALISAPDSVSSIKGKGKAIDGGRIGLWRMTGSRVWEVDTEGEVGGLAWSVDGLHLSLLVSLTPTGGASTYTLKHLSVHDGSTIGDVPLGDVAVPVNSLKDIQAGNRWWTMEWESSGLSWEKPRPGSSRMIIDSLPRPSSVEPPQPANMLPSMLKAAAAAAKSKPKFHPRLSTFPALLSSASETSPDILHLSPPCSSTSQRFLTGAFPLRDKPPSPSLLAFSQLSERLTQYLEIVIRGLESAAHAFGEGQKQGMIWREELETCGEQQGLSKADVHADLFGLLLTGRGGVAVSEWLGNRLTGRTITKWEATLETSFKTIRKVITESITPALERIVLILEEIIGWSKSSHHRAGLILPERSYLRLLQTTCDTIKLVESMRQLASHELHASMEFMKWLRFETSRTAREVSQDNAQVANYDLKYTWAYLKGGFVESPFTKHFPSLDKPAEEVISYVESEVSKTPPLRDIVQSALGRLNRRELEQDIGDVQGDPSEYSSMAMTDAELSMSEVLASPESSDSEDTVEKREPSKSPERVLRLEPRVWVNTLVKECESLVRAAVGGSRGRSDGVNLDPGGSSLYVERRDGDTTWVAFIPAQRVPQELWLLSSSTSDASSATLSVMAIKDEEGGNARCLAMQFFDNEELALLLESTEGDTERFLTTVQYTKLEMETVPIPQRSLGELARDAEQGFLQPVPIHRSRQLATSATKDEDLKSSIALNGRKGRRVGCVSTGDGTEVEVFDMDEDEDGEEEDEMGEDMSGVEEE